MAVSQEPPTHHQWPYICQDKQIVIEKIHRNKKVPQYEKENFKDLLIKVCENVYSKGVLLVQLVAICILYCILSLGW